MEDSIYSVLLVGLGNIGLYYDFSQSNKTWTHTRAIENHPRFRFVGAVDPNAKSRADFESVTGVRAYSSVESFNKLSNCAFDLAIVASPTECHLADVQSVMDCGVRLCVVEKPLGIGMNDVKRFNVYQDRLMVNLIRLYHDQLMDAIRKLSQGLFCHVVVTYSKGLIHNGIHFLSLLMAHFGSVHQSQCIQVGSEKVVVFNFKRANCIFKPSPTGLDENSMVIQSSNGSLYYMNGGRHAFTLDIDGHLSKLSEYEFNHYQVGLYSVCESVLDGKEDRVHSFKLARDAQIEMEPFHDL